MTIIFVCVSMSTSLDVIRLCVFLCQPLWMLLGCVCFYVNLSGCYYVVIFYVSWTFMLFFVHPHVMRREDLCKISLAKHNVFPI